MTAKEKLAMEHPDDINDGAIGGCNGCPDHYEYLPKPYYCYDRPRPCGSRCTECWGREIPEEVVDKFNAIGNAYPVFPDELREEKENEHV